MTIEPDTKDWTWVLRDPCPACGLAAADVPPAEVAGRVLAEDDPEFADWDQDATALADDYATQDSAVVAIQLSMEARALAGTLDAVAGDAWERTGRRDNGSSFTVTTLVQYLLHDHVHHLHDVGA